MASGEPDVMASWMACGLAPATRLALPAAAIEIPETATTRELH